MAPTRVLVVSDSHLSRRTPEASANWAAVVDYVTLVEPDLVVHAGDVTADAPTYPSDLDLAREELARIDRPLYAIPGNHDIGDNPHAGVPTSGRGATGSTDDGRLVTAARLARYRDHLGPDCWQVEVPGWLLVGLNSLLFGSGLDDEAEQWSWLANVFRRDRGPGHRRVALFLHKPLVPTPLRPDDANPGRYVPLPARSWLRELLLLSPDAVVLSGHAHQFSLHHTGGLTHVWVPSTWAVIPDRFQPLLGRKVCGLVELVLGADGASRISLRQPPGVPQQFLVDDIDDPYGAYPPARARGA